MAPPHGLVWTEDIWGLEPQWTVEPSIAAIETLSRQHLQFEDGTRCNVSFFGQGAFNKLYTVETSAGTFMMRVALPVDPHKKTASEVATISFVRENTSAPVPGILAYDSSSDNILKFEWILMQQMPGQAMDKVWRTMSMTKKEAAIKQIAAYQAQLFTKRFSSIGNLYRGIGDPNCNSIGSIVSMQVFWGDRGTREVSRGPFRNSYEWISARLTLTIQDQEEILQKPEIDEDDTDDATRNKTTAIQLLNLLPAFLSPDDVEGTIIFHDDLSQQNILVDENHDLSAVLDWECVSTFPLWKACDLPCIVNGRTHDEPNRSKYGAYDPETNHGGFEENEGLCDLYWEHLEEYEVRVLRSVFLDEMGRLQPEWIREYREGELKRDFELAVLYCSSELNARSVRDWVDAFKKGQPFSLKGRLTEYPEV